MHDASQAPKQRFNEWLRQLSDADLQVLLWWIDRKMENPDQPWDSARRTCEWLGDMDLPYTVNWLDEK